MRFYITEKQSIIIKEALLGESLTENSIDSPISSLDKMLLSKLSAKRLQEVTSCFSDDISSVDKKEVENKLGRLMNACRKKEEKIRPQLEKICFNVLTEMFNIPEDCVFYECHLTDAINPSQEFHMYPNTNEEDDYENYDEIDNEANEVEKRKILQALFIGGSLRLYEKSRKLFIDEIFELDESLPHLYSKIIKLNNYLLTVNNIKNDDKHHNQGGYVEVKLGNKEKQTEINVKATIFPILLIESIRGFLELFVSHGLPNSLKLAKTVISKSDVVEDEPWYMKFGPILWDRFIGKTGEIETEELPNILMSFSEIPSREFIEISIEMFYNTRRGNDLINQIVDKAKHDAEYEKFQNDIIQKQNDKNLIEDDYFSDDEICEQEW